MPLRSWAAHYREVESARLRHYARMVGIVHAKNPAKAQRALLRAAAEVRTGRKAGLDLLAGDPRKLRERLRGLAGVVVETKPAEGGDAADKPDDGG